MHPFNIWNKNQLMSLFQLYLYIARSLHISGPPAHPQESSHSCSHNHWFSVYTALAVCSVQSTWPELYRHWTNGCVNSCVVNSPEDGPVGPKHVEIRQYINKIEIVTSVGFYSISSGLLHWIVGSLILNISKTVCSFEIVGIMTLLFSITTQKTWILWLCTCRKHQLALQTRVC